jgi:AcrR family transcriptional regulator
VSRRRTEPVERRRAYDASGRRADAEERRRRVIEAAEILFLERGYGETSIAAIAEAAGVSPQFVYAEFDSKAGVLVRIAESAIVETTEDAGPLRDQAAVVPVLQPGLAPGTRIAMMAAIGTGVHERSGRVIRLMDSVAGADDAVRQQDSRLLDGSVADCILGLQAFAPGELRTDLTIQRMGEIVSTVGGFRTYATLVFDHGWSPREFEAWLAETFRRLLLSDPATTEGLADLPAEPRRANKRGRPPHTASGPSRR